jgi:hypothetical protein
MSGIIEGFNYNIFISYRQDDIKHDGRVSDFIENLKGEIETILGEDIYIFFEELRQLIILARQLIRIPGLIYLNHEL